MKVLALLFFVFGLAAASFHDALLENAKRDVVNDFLQGLDDVPSLKDFMGLQHSEELDEVEEEIKATLGDVLRKTLDELVQKIKTKVEEKHQIATDLLEKADETLQKLKELGLDASTKTKELLNSLKGRVKDLLRSLLERLGLAKRSLGDFALELLVKLELDDIVKQVKKMIEEKLSLDVIKAYILKALGESKLAQDIFKWIDLKSTDELKAVVSYILELVLKETKHTRSLVDFWSKVKDFLKDLNVESRDRFYKFASWLKSAWTVGIEKASDKMDRLRQVAKQFVADSSELADEVLQEGLELFRQYKDQLGDLWEEVVEAVHKFRNH